MDKELALQTMMLLSALESWGFATKERIPDYLLEDIEKVQDRLKDIVLGQNESENFHRIAAEQLMRYGPNEGRF